MTHPPVLTAAAAASALLALATTASVASAREVDADRSLVQATVRVTDRRLTESSGLARSTYHEEVLWTHNDSGAGAVAYAVGAGGAIKATIRLGGAAAWDWEDIASGPGHQIWVGDIGDNRSQRSHITVYRFKEPAILKNQTVPAAGFDLVYPDGPHNAEGMMLDPDDNRLYIVTKAARGAGI